MATLIWEPPAHNGDDDNTMTLYGYKVTQLTSDGQRSTSTTEADVTSFALPDDFDGYVWVSAVNAMGVSQASAAVRVVAP